MTAANVFNKRAVTGVYESIDSLNALSFIAPNGLCHKNSTVVGPCTIGGGAFAYAAYERPYDISALMNNALTNPTAAGGPMTVNSQYR